MSVDIENHPPTSGWFSWLGYYLFPSTSSSITPPPSPPANLDDWSEWEWVLSRTEEFLVKQSQVEIAKTLCELDSLRASPHLKIKPIFLKGAMETILSLRPEDRAELHHSLDSSKRSKVITDIVRQFGDEWREWIRTHCFEGDVQLQSEKWNRFILSYSEQTYSKNTIGILREVGWQASHGVDGTLSPRVLGDITWSICNALRGAIRGALEHDIDQV
eukprot:TRINITY_DN8004_c0_g1_i1.p1 TRINITY_DN8004_c0_g1~~TRINITY_DN8004_c0_g1_i1.p1  ORF type:complete len:217 (-),score=12.78 TRINITY_DN8004_c0_g1_i1:65-715(-)